MPYAPCLGRAWGSRAELSFGEGRFVDACDNDELAAGAHPTRGVVSEVR